MKRKGRSNKATTSPTRQAASVMEKETQDRTGCCNPVIPGGQQKSTRRKKANRKPVSEIDVDALLLEALPDEHTERVQLVAFVKRQYAGYQIVGRKTSLFQYRMGQVLCQLRPQSSQGQWESFIQATFEFTVRTARNWIRLAEASSEEEAKTTPATELMQAKGVIPYRTEKSQKPPETSGSQPTADPDDGMADLDTVGNKVAKVTRLARELKQQIESLPPQSYASNEKHAAFLKSFATEIEGAILNLYRSIVALEEQVKSANDASLADAQQALEYHKARLAVLEAPNFAIAETDVEDAA